MGFSINWLRELLYPSLCVHCKILLSQSQGLFCKECLEQITLLDKEGRCRRCFGELGQGKCQRCCQRSSVISKCIATIEEIGVAQTLIKEVKQGEEKSIAAAAALMAYQWLEKGGAVPDLIVPLPTPYLYRVFQGKDISLLLAQSLGKMFSVSLSNALRAHYDHASFIQTGRIRTVFSLRTLLQGSLVDRSLLLVSLKWTDEVGQEAAASLASVYPTQIDALTLVF